MKIIEKIRLAAAGETVITQLKIHSPHIAEKALPGQFVIVMVSEKGERIPLTLVDTDPKSGIITVIFQEVGYSTKLLGQLNPSQSLYSLAGPLGRPSPIKKYGKVVVVGGGVGIAEVLPVARALQKEGNTIYTVLGARTKDLVILQDEIRRYSERILCATDDGSFGDKGFVTTPLIQFFEEIPEIKLVYCVGPLLMMKSVSELTRSRGIPTIVCLNAIMLDGTGMCGSCRLTIEGKIKFCCVDGPDFDGHKVDFDELLMRQNRFVHQERQALKGYCRSECSNNHTKIDKP